MYRRRYPRPPGATGPGRGWRDEPRASRVSTSTGSPPGSRRNVAGARGPAHLRPHRGWPLQPHLQGHRRRRHRLRAAPSAARPRAGHRPRHGPRAQDHLRPRPHRRAGRAGPRALHRRRGERRALLRHGLRRRARPPRRGRRHVDHAPTPAATPATPSPTRWPKIHAVDPDAVGLGDLGKKEDYIHAAAQALVRPVGEVEDPRAAAGRRDPRRAARQGPRAGRRPRSSTATTGSTTA